MTRAYTIGVLALQGAFIEHVEMLEKSLQKASVSGSVIEVRSNEELESCDALVIPGGESTAISLVAQRCGLLEPLREFVKTKPTWGTCAGLILLAKEIHKDTENTQCLGGLDIVVQRNHFGRQLDSFIEKTDIKGVGQLECVYIRAPIVESVGKAVEVLGTTSRGEIVAVEQGHLLGTAFHPELTEDTRVHEYFLQKVINI